jgi:4-amino-4-deoxy-L-arabinose transferase-like glycosyltransferase
MSKKKNAILLIILIALSIRLWGISYDLPYIYHPDEPWPIRISYLMLKTGDFNPHFFDWPSFVIYINLLIQAVYYFMGRLFGFWVSPGDISPLVELTMGVTYSPSPIIVLLGRIVTIGFGVGTVVITIWAGEKLTHKAEVGLLAGMMMAISPTNVYLNRFITPDSYATFFITAAFLASILILQQGKTWAYIIAGICFGLAASSKYNGALVVVVLLASHFLRNGLLGYRDYRLYLALFLGVLAFILTTPYAILDFPAFYAGLQFNSQHYSTGHAGMEGNTLQWYLEYLWKTTGPISLMAVLGIVLGVYARAKEKILLAVFPVLYFILINRFVVRNDRTLMPITPFLFLLAASFLVYLFGRANVVQSKILRKVCISVLASLTAAIPVFLISETITDTLQLTTTNSRETARIWIANNLPVGTKIAIESYSPFVDPVHFSVQGVWRIIDHNPEWYIENGFEYLVFSQDTYERFYREPDRYSPEISQYNSFFDRFVLTKMFTDGGYEVRVYKVK